MKTSTALQRLFIDYSVLTFEQNFRFKFSWKLTASEPYVDETLSKLGFFEWFKRFNYGQYSVRL